MMEFTKEQLIERINETLPCFRHCITPDNELQTLKKTVAIYEVALAVLTAPDDIPPHVLDGMSDMCDAGFDGQGIWDLCRASIMPPTPCPRCGTVSDRPDGAHYCHVGVKGE
ncbi:hypothetical protein DEO48_00720 [Enterobacter sp. CGMCC 5087]|uniref:hypothetical protein n=1 Tax=Enterobacter sp. CGMCC 5087 TaxID=2183878 RepID=UPI000D676FA8|nr:hypothetical protein [Enterobacter sp. CGMCC 5087]PWI82112.1 hypothetical protein DEO48_00720 [Enterobacter sp. CGMCC 5087]